MPPLHYEHVQPDLHLVDFDVLTPHLLQLMLRNVATDGFSFVHEESGGSTHVSQPGCVIASPSYPVDLSRVDQDYVHHWTRDAAIVALELAAQPMVLDPLGGSPQLCDYVAFSRTCQDAANAAGHFYRAAFLVDGSVRDWSDQMDGPALQNLALVAAWPRLDAAARTTASAVGQANLDHIVGDWAHDQDMVNLWEEVRGPSFFTRSVQLCCLHEVQGANALGLAAPDGLDEAVDGLEQALAAHWDEQQQLYRSVPNGTLPGNSVTDLSRYDPNADVVSAAVYGAVSCTDPKLLATAARVREQYVSGEYAYPINGADEALGIGPLIGRYPGDVYDGDVGKDRAAGQRGHPWALCTANLAELCYRVAHEFRTGNGVGWDELTGPFFAPLDLDQATVDDHAAAGRVADTLRDAGDRMLRAIVYHSDHYELSEQFDAWTGYEKSVTNLTWSYAAFLSAVRAR